MRIEAKGRKSAGRKGKRQRSTSQRIAFVTFGINIETTIAMNEPKVVSKAQSRLVSR